MHGNHKSRSPEGDCHGNDALVKRKRAINVEANEEECHGNGALGICKGVLIAEALRNSIMGIGYRGYAGEP